MMKVRGWLMIGGEEVANGLPTSAAFVGPGASPYLPDAADVDLGRWILWSPDLTGKPVCLVCVELPLRYDY